MTRVIIKIKDNVSSKEFDIMRAQLDLFIKNNDVAIELFDREMEMYPK